MGVFTGEAKNTQAVGSALEINYAVNKVINPMVKEVYPSVSFELNHAVGIDTSPLFIARTGVRGSNDLVWVGRAANYAAKLCSFRESAYHSWITADVFNRMQDSVKFSKGDSGDPMWEERSWTTEGISVYRSSWMRSP
jgi:class 3 adenylate cyclase